MREVFFWRGDPVRFGPGDTVATALWRQGVTAFGPSARAAGHAVYCGIGQCQACLVMDADGAVFEACLHRPLPGAHLVGVMDALPGDGPGAESPSSPDAGREAVGRPLCEDG